MMYNPSFIGFLQHIDWCVQCRSIDASPVSCTFTVIISVVVPSCFIYKLVTVHKIFIFKPSEFQFKEPPLPSEFKKAVCHGVWIFSGIAPYSFPKPMKKFDFFWWSWATCQWHFKTSSTGNQNAYFGSPGECLLLISFPSTECACIWITSRMLVVDFILIHRASISLGDVVSEMEGSCTCVIFVLPTYLLMLRN